jgi:prepilin-type N-terminal cleavage/methylation domain-containing protein
MKLKVLQRRGFTLIEVLIVVIVLGVLATVVIAQFSGVTFDAQQAAFATSARTFIRAAELYKLDHGSYPDAAAPGQVPPGMEPYITVQQWQSATPFGGQWDCASDGFGFTFSLGVFFPPPVQPQEEEYMLRFDQTYDDGNLDTGSFQQMSNSHFFYVVGF